VGVGLPRIRVADPDRQGCLIDVPVTIDGDHARAQLPEVHLWQLVLIDPAGPSPADRAATRELDTDDLGSA
jgi:dextranase